MAKTPAPPIPTDLEGFKQHVVNVALDEAEKQGWCDEIFDVLSTRLGLAAYLPEQFAIETRTARGMTWTTCTVLDDDLDEDEARSEALHYAQSAYTNAYRSLNGHDRYRRTQHVPVYAGREDDAIEQIKRIKDQREHDETMTKKPVKLKTLPRFRVAVYRGRDFVRAFDEVPLDSYPVPEEDIYL